MKNSVIALIFILISGLSFVAQAIPVQASQGKIEFLAIGRPAMIKIKGEGPGPTGQFDLKKSGEDLKLNANLIVDLDTLETGIGLRDRHMKEKYLETAKFKTATLKINQAPLPTSALQGTGNFSVPGTLTIRGVEKPVEISIKLETTGEKIKSQSAFKINLADFTIDIPKYAGITVANDVEVRVETVVVKTDLKEMK